MQLHVPTLRTAKLTRRQGYRKAPRPQGKVRAIPVGETMSDELLEAQRVGDHILRYIAVDVVKYANFGKRLVRFRHVDDQWSKLGKAPQHASHHTVSVKCDVELQAPLTMWEASWVLQRQAHGHKKKNESTRSSTSNDS